VAEAGIKRVTTDLSQIIRSRRHVVGNQPYHRAVGS